MKRKRFSALFSAVFLALTFGNTISATSAVVERGPHHRVIENVFSLTNSAGQVVLKTNRYTALENGMHYQAVAGGPWIESEAVIEQHPQGAVAQRGQMKVIFSLNLNSVGAVDILAPDQKRLRVNVLALAWKDAATGQTLTIAEVKGQHR